MRVTWKNSPTNFHKADAQKCYEEMGSADITPEKVLEIAKDENSELHKCFEWDDSVAAEKYRLNQARMIIVNLVIEQKDKEAEPIRVFQISSEKQTYQPIQLFVENDNEYQTLLKRAKSELVAVRNRYSQIAELETVFEAIDSL